MREYEIDGAQFSTLEGFFAALDPILRDVGLWAEEDGRLDLQILDEVLYGWYNKQATDEDYWLPGKPDSFTLRWTNASQSRKRLGKRATIKEEKKHLAMWQRRDDLKAFWGDESARRSQEAIRENIRLLRMGTGKTLFDQIEQTFLDHAPGATEDNVDGVILLLD